MEQQFIFKGRLDRTIKHHGKLIALEEIELCLKAHQAIQDAVVIHKNKSLEAFITLLEGNSITQSRVMSYLNSILPGI